MRLDTVVRQATRVMRGGNSHEWFGVGASDALLNLLHGLLSQQSSSETALISSGQPRQACVGALEPGGCSTSGSSEQRPAQQRKYRLPIEPIAARYAAAALQSRASIAPRYRNKSHSAFKFVSAALHSGGRCTVRRQQPGGAAMFARLIQLCSAGLLLCALSASLPTHVGRQRRHHQGQKRLSHG
jgi:hypothetical protein